MKRKKICFDYDWKFALGDYPEASKPDFDDSEWRKLDLPHDWSIEGEFDKNNPTGVMVPIYRQVLAGIASVLVDHNLLLLY